MYSVLHKLSEDIYLCMSKSITSHAFLPVFKIVGSLQCILNWHKVEILLTVKVKTLFGVQRSPQNCHPRFLKLKLSEQIILIKKLL